MTSQLLKQCFLMTLLAAGVAMVGCTTPGDAKPAEEAVVEVAPVISPEEIAAPEIGKCTRAVNILLAKGEYERAREAIWRFTDRTACPEANELIKEARNKLMTEVVNVRQWLEVEKQVLDTVTPLLKDKKYAQVRAYLDTVKPIRTYTVLFDQRVDGVAKAMAAMGIPEEGIDPICAAAREMIAAAFISSGERYDSTKTVEEADDASYRAAVENLRKTLVKYDCPEAKADEIVATFDQGIIPLIEKHCITERMSTSLAQLGTTEFNVKLEALRAKILAQVTEAETLALAEALEKAMREQNWEAARRYAVAMGTAEPLVNVLVAKVRAAIEAGDWEAARAIIRDEPRVGNVDVDLVIYALRIGLLNSEVNPAQCAALLEQMNGRYKAFIAKGDLEGCKKWLETSPVVVDDYPKIIAALQAAAETMGALGIDTAMTQEKIAAAQQELQAILDRREGSFAETKTFDLTELEKALAALEEAILDQTMNEPLAKEKAEILRAFAKSQENPTPKSMTTHEMNLALLTQWELLKQDLAAAIAKAELEKLANAYKAQLAAMDAEVSFDTQIAIAEDGILRGLANRSEGLHAVLGEYARAFRLLKADAELTADQKQTLLVGAAWLNQPQVVTWALDLGAEIDTPAARDTLERPAILVAIQTGNISLIRTLIDAGAAMNAMDADQNTVLHYAARLGSLDLIKVALKSNDVNAVNRMGQSALFIPAAFNRLAHVNLLLAEEADPTIADCNGMTAFDVACDTKSLLVLDPLVEAGAPMSMAAFCRAVRVDGLALAQWFVAHGADVNAEGVMNAAAMSRDADNAPATYNYLVSQGGIPVALPEPVVEVVEEAPVLPPPPPAKGCCH